ncbi:MAG: hypothetical protein AB8H12_12840 [Lewinella sp.]
MYNTIREKIRENRIAEALKEMDELQLSREHTSRLVNLHRRYRVYQDKAISNLAEERLLRIEENGIVEDILTFLDMVEYPAKYEQEEEVGGAAGAKNKDEQRKEKGNRWLLSAIGLIALALVAFWWLQSDNDPTPAKPAVEAQEKPEEPDKPDANRPTLTNPRIPDAKVTLNPDVLDRVELKPATGLKIDPSVLSKALLLQPFMTEGKRVPMALAFYYNKKSPTEYNETMTRQMGGFVRSFLQREISMDVLTKAFHQSEIRERVVLAGTSEKDKRLKTERAPYLLLLDVRNEQRNKGYMRICLFDVSRQKGFTRGKSVTLRDSNGKIVYREIANFVQEYLTELREKAVFK